MKRYKIGLKLWSPNEHYIRPALDLFNAGVYDYIELYAVPDSFGFLAKWQDLARTIPFAIHAPHFSSGLDFSNPQKRDFNAHLVEQVKRWSGELNAVYTLFHPGIGGEVSESIEQMRAIKNLDFIVENKPHIVPLKNSDKTAICVGATPSDIAAILSAVGCGFCLDIGHAICSANARGEDIFKELGAFNDLGPAVYHLSDNYSDAKFDAHLNFGEGDFDFRRIFEVISGAARTTFDGSTSTAGTSAGAAKNSHFLAIETNKKSQTDLDDFAHDAAFLKRFL